jgi:hypothetical protein
MTAPKPEAPTLDEQIAYLQSEPLAKSKGSFYSAILETLRAHKAIMEAERPEPVGSVGRTFIGEQKARWYKPLGKGTKLYGPDLLEYADRMAAERDEATAYVDEIKEQGGHLYCTTCGSCGEEGCCPTGVCWRTRAENAERRAAEFERDARRYKYIREFGLLDWDGLALPPAFRYTPEAEDAGHTLMMDEAVDAAMLRAATGKGSE